MFMSISMTFRWSWLGVSHFSLLNPIILTCKSPVKSHDISIISPLHPTKFPLNSNNDGWGYDGDIMGYYGNIFLILHSTKSHDISTISPIKLILFDGSSNGWSGDSGIANWKCRFSFFCSYITIYSFWVYIVLYHNIWGL